MTSLQTVNMVRLLLDDARDWFWPIAEIIASVNEAQNRILRMAYMAGDERCLRPLYRLGSGLQDNTVVLDPLSGNPLLYPRSCRVYQFNGVARPPISQTQTATYIEEPTYYNYLTTEMVRINSGTVTFPRAAFYTIVKAFNTGTGRLEATIRFSSPNAQTTADLWFIPELQPFTYTDPTALNDTPLQLPNEYHMRITTLAAELLNDLDVNERERGNLVFQNTGVPIKDMGE